MCSFFFFCWGVKQDRNKKERSCLDLDEVEKSRCRFFISHCVIFFWCSTLLLLLLLLLLCYIATAYRRTRSLTGGELMCVLVVATNKSEYSFFSVLFFIWWNMVLWQPTASGYILEKFSRGTRVCRRWWPVTWWRWSWLLCWFGIEAVSQCRIFCYFFFSSSFPSLRCLGGWK